MADAKIKLSVDGTAQVVVDLSSIESKMANLEKQVTSSGMKIKDVMAMAGGALASFAIVDKIKDMAMLNARYETLGVSMAVVGKNAGYTSDQMESTAQALQKTGISMLESRQQTMRLVQAHIDLKHATELARIAQDAAVIGNMNSSEAFAHMIHGIQTGQPEVLRTIGLNVSMEESYKRMATQLGKHKDMLTQNERTQAVLNSVMAAGSDIAGTYATAMDTAGKQILSMTRYTEDIKVLQGQVFNEVLTIAVMGYTEHLKEANGQLNEMAKNRELQEWGQNIAYTFSWLADIVEGSKSSVMLFGETLGVVGAKWNNWREYAAQKEEAAAKFSGQQLVEENARILAAYDKRRAVIDDAYAQSQDSVLNKQGRFVRAYEERLKALAEKEEKINAEKVAKQQDYFDKVLQLQTAYAGYSIQIQQQAQMALAQSFFGDNHKFKDTVPAPKTSEKESDYQRLTKALNEKISVQMQDIATLDKLTEGEKQAAKVRADLSGKTIELTRQEKERVFALTRTLTELEKHNRLIKELEKQGATQAKISLDGINQQTAAFIKANTAADDYAMSVKEAADQVNFEASIMLRSSTERAVLLEQYKIEVDLRKKIADIQKQNILDVDKEVLITKMQSEAMKAKASAVTKVQVGEWSKTVETMDKTFHDGFVAALERGEGAWKSWTTSLRNTFKSALVDQLYAMFARPFVMQIVAGMGGMLGMNGAAQAAGAVTGSAGSMGGFSLSNLFSAGKSLFEGFSSAGAGSGFWGSLAGGLNGAGLGSGLGSELGVTIGNKIAGIVGPSIAQSLSSGVTAIGGMMPYAQAVGMLYMGNQFGKMISGGKSIGPIGGNALVNAGTLLLGIPGAIGAGLLNRAFGMGEKQVTGTNVSGTLGTDNLYRNVNWHQDGGWFRSDRNGTWSYNLANSTAIADGKAYQDGASQEADKALLKGLTDSYTALKKASADYASALGLNASQIAGRTDEISFAIGKDAAETQANIAKMFGDIGNKIASELLGPLAKLGLADESAAATLERLSNEVKAADSVISALGLRAIMAGTNEQMVTAKDRLVTLAGGLQSFNQSAAFFAENFLTDAEKVKPAQDAVKKTFAEFGISGVSTTEQFKKLVQGLDLSTEAGAKQYAALMLLAPAFKQVADYSQKATDAAQQLADKQKEVTRTTLQSTLDSWSSFAAKMKDYSASLLLGSASPLTPAQQYAEAKRQFDDIYAKAKAGDKDAQGKYTDAANNFLNLSRVVNASSAGYQLDFNKVLQASNEAGTWANQQADLAKASLDALNVINDSIQQLSEALVGKPRVDLKHPDYRITDPGVQVEAFPVATAMPDFSQYGKDNTLVLIAEIKRLNDKVEQLTQRQDANTEALISAGYDANLKASERVAESMLTAADRQVWAKQSEAVIR